MHYHHYITIYTLDDAAICCHTYLFHFSVNIQTRTLYFFQNQEKLLQYEFQIMKLFQIIKLRHHKDSWKSIKPTYLNNFAASSEIVKLLCIKMS